MAFEYSDVKASIKGTVESVKNPLSGYIHAGRIGKIIIDEHCAKNAGCEIKTLK